MGAPRTSSAVPVVALDLADECEVAVAQDGRRRLRRRARRARARDGRRGASIQTYHPITATMSTSPSTSQRSVYWTGAGSRYRRACRWASRRWKRTGTTSSSGHALTADAEFLELVEVSGGRAGDGLGRTHAERVVPADEAGRAARSATSTMPPVYVRAHEVGVADETRAPRAARAGGGAISISSVTARRRRSRRRSCAAGRSRAT